jgi:hypothetical protein
MKGRDCWLVVADRTCLHEGRRLAAAAHAHLLPPATLHAGQAIKVFEDFAWSDRLRLDWQLRPGDIQLLSNHTCLHSREGFRDHPTDPKQQRHLLRLWIAPPEERPLPPAYGEIMAGSLEVGDRGGIAAEQAWNVPLHPHA